MAQKENEWTRLAHSIDALTASALAEHELASAVPARGGAEEIRAHDFDKSSWRDFAHTVDALTASAISDAERESYGNTSSTLELGEIYPVDGPLDKRPERDTNGASITNSSWTDFCHAVDVLTASAVTEYDLDNRELAEADEAIAAKFQNASADARLRIATQAFATATVRATAIKDGGLRRRFHLRIRALPTALVAGLVLFIGVPASIERDYKKGQEYIQLVAQRSAERERQAKEERQEVVRDQHVAAVEAERQQRQLLEAERLEAEQAVSLRPAPAYRAYLEEPSHRETVYCTNINGIRICESAKGKLEQGIAAYARGDYEAAVAALKLANADEPLANFYLARIYADNSGAFTNHAAAYEFYAGFADKFADADPVKDPRAPFVGKALTALARYLLRGLPEIGLKPNSEVAADYLYNASTTFGDDDAQFELAKLQLKGEGVEKDAAKAKHGLSTLSRSGHAGAQAFLADLMWRGEQIDKNPSQSLALIVVAVANAPSKDRKWIEDIYQNIYCGSVEGVRSQAGKIVAGWGDRYSYHRKSDTVPGNVYDVYDPAVSAGKSHVIGRGRTCANGEAVPVPMAGTKSNRDLEPGVALEARPKP